MKIQGYDSYNQYNTYTSAVNPSARTGKVNGADTKLQGGQQASGTEIITNKERDFFINMFPESSEQLARHQVFNRNGKVEDVNIYKGTIVDGRA